MSEATIISRLDRIDKKLDKLFAKREIWVGASDIMKVTGWSASDMYRMRKAGAIVYKKMGKSILYDPNSIPSIFIRHENSTTRSRGVAQAGAILDQTKKVDA